MTVNLAGVHISQCICTLNFHIMHIKKKSHLHLKYTQLLFVAVESLGRVRLFETPWTVAPQAPLSMGFPRKEHWSGLPGPLPGDLPDSESNLSLLHWQADSLPPSYLRALSTHYQVSNVIILVILHNRHYYPHFGNEGVQNPKEKWLINTRAWIQP